MTVWFTADTHFGHANIVKYCQRPFETVQEMDHALIERWNERVQPDDVVWHLGDFCFGGKEEAKGYFARLNGVIRVLYLPWHHDKSWGDRSEQVYCGTRSGHVMLMGPLEVVKVPEIMLPTGRGHMVFTLSHYPLRTWDRSFDGGLHLFGHEHNRLPVLEGAIDVGVDNPFCNFGPVALKDVLKHFGYQEKKDGVESPSA